MKLNRSKNAIRNAQYGFIEKIITIIFPFIVRTLFIRILGAECLGLNSLFASVLTVLNLTELGFSSAIVFCMYKPIAENDHEQINALLLFYKKVYQYIGIIISVIGLALIPFLHLWIKGNYPSNINIIVIYLIYLLNTVLSYFLCAYKQALISAFQRNDLISKTNIIISIAMYCLQMIILITTRNYYLFTILMPVFTVINNLRLAVIAKHVFPQYVPKGKLSKEIKNKINEKVKGLVINKVCMVSRNAFDSIFISMFLGLRDTAMYNNYYYIMNAVIAIMAVLTGSIIAGIGNSVSIESVEKNYRDMMRINFIYMWLAGFCTVCLTCLYQPFIRLWVGESLMFNFKIVILICIYFYVLKMGDIRSVYVQATGLWWQNRYRALAEAMVNILLNYLLGKYYGIYGIICSTLISLFFINYCYGTQIIYKYYFKEQKMNEYFILNSVYAFVTIIVTLLTNYMCKQIKGEGWISFGIKCVLCITISNILFYLFYCKTKIFKESMLWFIPRIKSKSEI